MKTFLLIVSFFTSGVLFNSCVYIECNRYKKKHKEVWDVCVQGIPTKNDIKRAFSTHSFPYKEIIKELRSWDKLFAKTKFIDIYPCWMNKTPWLGMKNIQYGYLVYYQHYNYNYFGMLVKDGLGIPSSSIILTNGKKLNDYYYPNHYLSSTRQNETVGQLGTKTTDCLIIKDYYNTINNKATTVTRAPSLLYFYGLGGDTREYYTKKVAKELGWK